MDITMNEAPAGVRRGSMVALFAAVAFMNTGMVGASTAGTLIASHGEGPGWSGSPNAAGVLGTALGALASGVLMARRGRRFALLTLYGLAVAGAVLAFAGAVAATLPALLAGMALLGLGNGGAQLSRYAAAELYPAERRGFGLSVIVWAGTVGALAGPALIAPAARAAERLMLPGLSGPIAASALVTAAAVAATALLPRTVTAQGTERPPGLSLSMVGTALRRPLVRTPLVAMMAAQMAMVAVMTMTPVQLHLHGHGLDVVGWVLSAHLIGMFALAPLSGWIADHWDGRVTIGCGIAVLMTAATTAMAAPTAHASGLPLALFLLGYGWNLMIVGGSSLLSGHLVAEERTQVQGVVDALVWSAAAIGSLVAGPLFGSGGYSLVAALAGTLALASLAPLARRR
ncbi:MFS transporter [Actinomadura sp. HBU206391]|uniref:MFS transporter n=1 Tax=Actinomadura sp. HBU206391 TaxID=2731692 RepID=UPI001C9D4DB1|nr:MFS transporter [Actinomadura sp. HBU206391]